MDTTAAEKDGDEWVINGTKRWNSGMHTADYDLVFARTSGEDGDGDGITAFLTPTDADGFEVDYYWWTFNMPTDHAEVSIDGVRVPDSAIIGEEEKASTWLSASFTRAVSDRRLPSLGAAQFCIDEAVEYAKERKTWENPWRTARRSSSRSPSCTPRRKCCETRFEKRQRRSTRKAR